IRDECRGDRKISRATLIGIARKKQVRGMETAYKKYQEKSAKKYEGRTERIAAAETAAKVLLWLNRTNSKLSLIDTSAWSSDEKNAFLELMNAIRETILTTMNPIPAEVAAAIPGDADNSAALLKLLS
ncbi:MAG: hypothetical protein L7F78_22985, partial [Syntrophales bacterium LBB04]|nr:hypothetical protein [Syntrophales bacterium LBB04]